MTFWKKKQDIGIEEEPQKKCEGSRASFFVGMSWGIFLAVGCAALILYLYVTMTGDYVVIGNGRHAVVPSNSIMDEQTAQKVDELMKYISLYYYDEFDAEELRTTLYQGLVEGLGDTYTVYYDKDEYQDLQVSTSGIFYGIGAGLVQDPDKKEVTVQTVYEGTPAQEAGLKKEDRILSADGVQAGSESLSNFVKHIRGAEGTEVHLEVYRASEDKTMEMDIERRNVQIPSVSGSMLEDGIGMVQVSEFQKGTPEQFLSEIEKLKSSGMTSMIIDLRGNPGGMLTSVVQMLDDLLPEGLLVYTEDKYQNQEKYTSQESCMEIPFVVLIDENSASASEIFAGAVKDYGYGTLIGTTTYGKGIVQTIFPLSDGDAVKITTARYFTPKGNYIHGIGIEPDIEVEYEYTGDEDAEYDYHFDRQVMKAVEVLLGNEDE